MLQILPFDKKCLNKIYIITFFYILKNLHIKPIATVMFLHFLLLIFHVS